jgi:DNA-binding response OmpR family regulator
VLYVEDDRANATLVRRLLNRRPNIELLVARSGSEGLRMAQECHPHLVLLDRHLPDMLGDDVLTQLRSSPVTVSIPVVILSGDSGQRLVDELVGFGACDFLIKPFDGSRFLAVIDKWVVVDPDDEVHETTTGTHS